VTDLPVADIDVPVPPAPPAVDPDGYADPKEGLDLRDDGGANLWVEGQRIRLRRPRARDYRYLRERLQDAIDQLNDQLEQHSSAEMAVSRLAEERVARGEPAMTHDEREAARQRSLDRNQLEEKVLSEWWLEVVGQLAVNQPYPALTVEDLPPWMPETPPCYLLLGHWRSVPSLSGGQ
jgi:hypothetical protein